MAIVSRAGRKTLARRRDLATLAAFGASFVVINVVLISLAYAAG